MKSIVFVTGTRADFGKLEPLALEAKKSGFLITFFITGMHMMQRYGETRVEVKRFSDAIFFEYENQKEGDLLDSILSKTILGFSEFLNHHKPDLVVIHGDRIESLAISIVCSTRQIRSAHIEGGELTGSIDESFRHCNSKLCTTHFVSSQVAKERLLRLGESSKSVYVIGSPELDVHANDSGLTINEVKKYYDIPFNDFGIVIFHPVFSELLTISYQAESLFTALKESKRNFVVILPNNDPGSEDIFFVIHKLPKTQFRVIPSRRFKYFSELMKNASVMVGNSSSGVREAPFFGIPSLDIGSRQNNRSKSKSIKKCAADDVDLIRSFLLKEWGKKYSSNDQFGSGNAAELFVNVISGFDFWEMTLQKVFEE